MATTELFQRLTVALAIGLLIGLERGWQMREEAEGERAAGLRTHALAALLGGVWAAISLRLDTNGSGGGIALGLAFAVTGGTIILFRYRETQHEGTFGATTVVAALLAFALGALAVMGDMAAAAAAAVATAGLLALKGSLHGWVRRLTWPELRSMLLIAAMSVILLPVLPNRTIDPLGAINPFEIWLLTVMIAAISFAGYVAIKVTGARRGIALTGFAGGLASSTVVTLTLARMAKDEPEQEALTAGGALIAGATMMARVIGLVAVTKPVLLDRIALPLAAAAAVTTLGGLALVTRPSPARNGEETIALKNPLDLAAVLRFGALLTLIGVLAQVMTRLVGSAGVYALAAISALVDVDAITLSMTRISDGTLSSGVAAGAILLAVAVNTITKTVLGWTAGSPGFGRRLTIAAAAAIAAGLACYAIGPIGLSGLILPRPA
jgi:uncharacterized membrane protein (DUF4010 family)